MAEREDSSSVCDDTSYDTESKKMKLDTSTNDEVQPVEIPVDDEIGSSNDQTESKKITFATAVPKDGMLFKDQIPSDIPKRQQKRMLKQLRWEKWKPLKRELQRSKKKLKRQEARLKNIELGPSRKSLKQSTMANSSCKQRIVIDFSYDHLMDERELRKACKQLTRCYSLNRRAKEPLQFYVTDFKGKVKEEMDKHPGYENWDLNFHEGHYLDIFDKKDIVYLSCDSINVLTEFNDNSVYIIGGLVDHNACKYESLNKAAQQGVRHARLPLHKYVEMEARSILTIDQVFDIILHITAGVPWKDALLKILPARKNVRPKQESQDA